MLTATNAETISHFRSLPIPRSLRYFPATPVSYHSGIQRIITFILLIVSPQRSIHIPHHADSAACKVTCNRLWTPPPPLRRRTAMWEILGTITQDFRLRWLPRTLTLTDPVPLQTFQDSLLHQTTRSAIGTTHCFFNLPLQLLSRPTYLFTRRASVRAKTEAGPYKATQVNTSWALKSTYFDRIGNDIFLKEKLKNAKLRAGYCSPTYARLCWIIRYVSNSTNFEKLFRKFREFESNVFPKLIWYG